MKKNDMLSPALYTNGKVFTGKNHGEAFSKLSLEEKKSDIQSGFFNLRTKKFESSESDFFYMMKVILIRHSETNKNKQAISDKGIKQSLKLKPHLSAFNYKYFSSPAKRCIETSLHLSNKFIVDKEFDERRENETHEDFFKRINKVIDLLPNKAIIVSHYDFIVYFIQAALMSNIEADDYNDRTIPHASLTVISNHKLVCVGEKNLSKNIKRNLL
jgi:broad specificity phosphatase PhoE